MTVAVLAQVALPLVIWDVSAFISSTVAYTLDVPYRHDSLSIPAILLQMGGLERRSPDARRGPPGTRPTDSTGSRDLATGRSDASVYDSRFTPGELAAKQAAWVEITRYLQRWVPHDGVVMDVATDRGDFIRNIGAGEKWACDVRDTSSALPPDVRFLQTDGLALTDHVPLGHFDVVFMSNYLEHLSASDQVVEQLRVARQLLKPGGRVIVLQPNIRHVGGAYWDYIDHRVALTDRSLEEAATLAGFRTVKLISRFLPYTVKGRLPTHPWLVRAYLAFPPAWLVMGQQTLYVGETGG